MISTSNANFLRKKEKSKNKEHIGTLKNKTDINNTDCVSLFLKYMYIYKYRMREGVNKCEIICNDARTKKTHSLWNALQDNENINIIITHQYNLC